MNLYNTWNAIYWHPPQSRSLNHNLFFEYSNYVAVARKCAYHAIEGCGVDGATMRRCVYLNHNTITTMVLVITPKKDKSLRQQMQALLTKKGKGKTTRWDLFFGKVAFEGDPVNYQRNLRDE